MNKQTHPSFLKRFPSLYLLHIRQFLLSLTEYRLDFLFGVASMFLIHLGTFCFIYLVFENIPTLQGYSFPEILFIFGFAILPQAFVTTFCSNLFRFSWYVRMGEMDRLLLRPLPPLFQIISARIDPNGLGNAIIGSTALTWSAIQLNLSLSFFGFMLFIALLAAATVILLSINIIIASTAFFTTRNESLVRFVNELDEFTYYPITIYHRSIQYFLTFILPFAFISFYPASGFLPGKTSFYAALATIPVAILCLTVSLLFFKFGIKNYESTGH